MKAFRRFLRKPLGVLATAMVVALVLVAALAPWIAPYDTAGASQDLTMKYRPPSTEHPFGTDHQGIDVLSRIVMGARLTLFVALAASALTVVIGLSLGLLAGYCGGRTDLLVMRLIDVAMAFPSLLLIIILAAALGQSLLAVFLALGLVNWAPVAQLVRGQVLSLKTREFVEGARALGAGHARILFRHVLPNCLSVILVVFTMRLGTMILAEASLNFLGLGPAHAENSWGFMVNTAYNQLAVAWWPSLFPASAIALTVIAFNLLGDAIRDAVDPRLRIDQNMPGPRH